MSASSEQGHLWRAIVGFAVLATVVGAGCTKRDITLTPAMLDSAPTRREIISTHNRRVALLTTTHSQGVAVVRWSEQGKRRSEQGDVELWQTTGNRTALRISVLGEVGLWLGSNGEQWWLFDLMDKQRRTLRTGSHQDVSEALGAIGMTPLTMLDLLGLTTLEPIHPGDGALDQRLGVQDFDSRRGCWVIEARGRGGPLRIGFDRITLLPAYVQVLDDSGDVAAQAELSRWEGVAVEGVAIMARPRMPLVVDIRRMSDPEREFNGEVRIAFNQTLATIDPRIEQRIFDLERLTASMRPDVIEVLGTTKGVP